MKEKKKFLLSGGAKGEVMHSKYKIMKLTITQCLEVNSCVFCADIQIEKTKLYKIQNTDLCFIQQIKTERKTHSETPI